MSAAEPAEYFANLSKYEFATLQRHLLLKKYSEQTNGTLYFLFGIHCLFREKSY